MEELKLFYPADHQKHAHPNHPERPERVEAIRSTLQQADLWKEEKLSAPLEIPEDVLYSIHDRSHIAQLQAASQRGGMIDGDTYIVNQSWQLALNAAGGSLAVAEAVWTRKAERGFALSRPPGHHATRYHAMGFCLLNNIALAAEYLLQQHDASRIAIIDIDLHHGNGTQDIFYERDDVFFCSIHQYPLYPMSGTIAEVGRGPGKNHTLNIPYPPYAGDQARMEALHTVILPLFEQFQPEMLLVSTGFDAHWRDPLGHQLATANGYGEVSAALTEFADIHCQGRIAFFLEGGYDLEGGAASALALTQATLGMQWQDLIGPSPMEEDPYWQNRLEQVAAQWQL
jgi:acetoin utilization deacetylase AcuC-like enzyme